MPPETTLNHFRALRGNISPEYLDEWIDIRLIADLTDQVGRLLWFPSIAFLVMLAARNQFTDHWPWSSALITIFTLNFSLAIISVIILQQAARKAKRDALDHLGEKIKRVQASIAPSAPANNAAQAKDLFDEIEGLHRGAFARPWENPVFGAILLPSGVTVLIQLLMWFNNR